ncbi:MAG: hypothetical protein IPG88_21040 [Gemmatimonadetes bacterium]|nr:hypothetical protein [Gemmatimonadota bacterium]
MTSGARVLTAIPARTDPLPTHPQSASLPRTSLQDRKQVAGRNIPWSTPISDYRVVDGIRIGTHGETNWVDPAGEWTYGKFDIRSVAYNIDR